FQNYENEKVVISGESVKDAEYETPIIHIHNQQYITISGLTIQDLSVWGNIQAVSRFCFFCSGLIVSKSDDNRN
ncbi:hypothetical protein JEM70_08645, partial [Bacillaceae bacterium HSR45]|nr:hypothetical protein [Bacillaceae bacterium HSR45]